MTVYCVWTAWRDSDDMLKVCATKEIAQKWIEEYVENISDRHPNLYSCDFAIIEEEVKQ